MAEMRDACYFCGLACVGVFSGFYPSGIAETHPAPGRSEVALPAQSHWEQRTGADLPPFVLHLPGFTPDVPAAAHETARVQG